LPPSMKEDMDAGQAAGERYWAFISYSHADSKWGQWLHRKLETFRVPRALVGKETPRGYKVPKRLMPIFRDREELPGSANLKDNIQEALEQSRYLVVICSPRSAASIWVNEEVLTYKAMGRSGRVLCLIVDGEPNATDKPSCGLLECFPPAVRHAVNSDRSLNERREEPIAADARPGKDGKNDAFLKIAAGLLGVGFDELKKRETARTRRARAVQALAAAILLSLACYAGVTIWHARQKANEEAQTAKEVLEFVLVRILSQSSSRLQQDSGFKPNPNITMLEVLDRAAAGIDGNFKDKPWVERRLRRIVGITYTELNVHSKALPHLRREVELAAQSLASDDPSRIGAELNLANCLMQLGELEQAEAIYSRLIGLENLPQKVSEEVFWKIAGGLARTLVNQEKNESAEKVIRASLRSRTNAALNEVPAQASDLIALLGRILHRQNKLTEAEEVLRTAVGHTEKHLGPRDESTLLAKSDLACVLADQGDLSQAKRLLEEVLQESIANYGDEDARTNEFRNQLAIVLRRSGDFDEAEALYKAALAGAEKLDAQNRKKTAQAIANNLRLLRRARVDDSIRRLGESHPETLLHKITLADYLRSQFDDKGVSEALRLYEEVLKVEEERFGGSHPETLNTMQRIAEAKAKLGEKQEAIGLLERVRAGFITAHGQTHRSSIIATLTLANLVGSTGRVEDAGKLLHDNLAAVESDVNLEPIDKMNSLNAVCEFYLEQKMFTEAAAFYPKLYELTLEHLGPSSTDSTMAASNMAYAKAKSGDPAGGAEILRSHISRDSASGNRLRYGLATYELAAGNSQEAKRLLAELIARFPALKQQALEDDELAELRNFIRNL
jgi:tetratricopeptide (TPR) repeat protein